MGGAGSLWSSLLRRRTVEELVASMPAESHAPTTAGNATSLKRQLRWHHVFLYGVGSTVGAGIYSLIAPGVAAAGPALVVSFLIGAAASVLTAFAYTEFAARCPVAGSAYTYAYTSFGELPAWFIGWTLTLEYGISSAAIARSWASYLGEIVRKASGDSMPDWLRGLPVAGGLEISVLAGLFVLACTAVSLVGVRESSNFNNVVTSVNIVVLTLVVIAGATVATPGNWTVMDGSFAPYGFSGILQGAGTIFFSYLGFDMVSSLAEEVQNPRFDLPCGILGSLGVSALLYVGVTLVVTGMVDFRALVNEDAPLVYAFDQHGYGAIAWIVNVGSLFGLTATTFTCLVGQPRIYFRMGVDGLLFPWCTRLSGRGVPTYGTIVTGLITALLATLLSLEALADAISIGTLFAFTIVNAGVVFLRYGTRPTPQDQPSSMRAAAATVSATGGGAGGGAGVGVGGRDARAEEAEGDEEEEEGERAIESNEKSSRRLLLLAREEESGRSTSTASEAEAAFVFRPVYPAWMMRAAWMRDPWILLSSFFVLILAAALVLRFGSSDAAAAALAAAAVVPVFILSRIPVDPRNVPATFACPLVPWVPCLGIAVNAFMVTALGADAWIRVGAWSVVGLVLYAGYGYWHSTLRPSGDAKKTDGDADASLTSSLLVNAAKAGPGGGSGGGGRGGGDGGVGEESTPLW